MSTPDPTNPVDPSSRDVDAALSDAGLTGQFEPRAGGFVHCLTCGATTPASEQSADEVTRLEGASDPADMQIVVPVACRSCGTAGTLVMSYGPEATVAEVDVLSNMPRTPRESTKASVFGGATPGMR